MIRKLKITVDGRAYDVTVEDVEESPSMLIPQPGDMAAAAAAAAPSAPAPAAAPAAAAAGPVGPGDVPSPLGGVVVSIDVSVGQQVNEGDKVATLEAMKMKTVVSASKTGKVANIAVKPGDGVEAGQVLMTIE